MFFYIKNSKKEEEKKKPELRANGLGQRAGQSDGTGYAGIYMGEIPSSSL